MPKDIRLPPGCGKLLNEPLYYQKRQQAFQKARRMRFCLSCKTMGSMTELGLFTCAKCGLEHNGRWGNLTAPRAYNRFCLIAGRGGGKTDCGARAVREELSIPGAVWWALGPTYKILHDSTYPTLIGLIAPHWVKRWDPEHMEVTLTNDSMIAFRSLEDPERARGPHGIGGVWFDEAAQSPHRAYQVAEPMLIKAGGIAITTTTPLGYDWTYDEIEKRALVYKEPGYWCAKWWSEENPLFRMNPVMKQTIERAKKTLTPEFYAQEYQAERNNAQGLIYGGAIINKNILKDDDEIRRYIPEWPQISAQRKVIIGLDEGGDHPFGATLTVQTHRGLVVVREYLERMRAHSQAHDDIWRAFNLAALGDKTFAANKNALNLRLEWGVKGTGVAPAESKHEVGIQRVQSWLITGQMKFAYTVPRTIEQMSSYRYGVNLKPSTGEKVEHEKVFKLKDELPDSVRYTVMVWPELPNPDAPPISEADQRRLDAFPEKVRWELERMAERAKRRKDDELGLQPCEDGFGYPTANWYQHDVDEWEGRL